MMHNEVINKHKVRYVEDKRGHRIPTHQTLYLYLRQIEDIVRRNPNTQFYNFLSHGACIKGTIDIDDQEALDLLLSHTLPHKQIAVPPVPVHDSEKEKILTQV